ncbi:MAG: nucleotide pyrophosphohydrolase [Methanotrichaceae archaeon]|nr:nucleotide pyrophosphohydrolase [Methanotrichaceae archaeon]
MSDRMDQLLQELLMFRRERDWGKFHTPRNLAIFISIEAAELLVHFPWRIEDKAMTSLAKEKIAEEIADTFIYLLLLSHDPGIDLVEAATKKIQENNERYPIEEAKGSAKKYT